MSADERDAWIDTRELARLLTQGRVNDVKVNVSGLLIPIQGAAYSSIADVVVIELAESLEKRILADAFAVYDRERPVDDE